MPRPQVLSVGWVCPKMCMSGDGYCHGVGMFSGGYVHEGGVDMSRGMSGWVLTFQTWDLAPY